MNFSSLAETPEGVLEDMGRHMARSFQAEDLIPQSVGVNGPMFSRAIRTGADLFEEVGSWFTTQRQRQGGRALDTPTTPGGHTYRDRRYEFLMAEEGVRERAYDDATGRTVDGSTPKRGNITVGIGFNMDRPDARTVWGRVFGDQGPSFDAVYNGTARLDRAQVRALFDYNADEAERVVNGRFRDVPLREHQRIALVSMAFNGPALIGPNLTAAIREGRSEEAAEIIRTASASRQPVLNRRREREASLFRGTNLT